jgi:hypothetical protein
MAVHTVMVASLQLYALMRVRRVRHVLRVISDAGSSVDDGEEDTVIRLPVTQQATQKCSATSASGSNDADIQSISVASNNEAAEVEGEPQEDAELPARKKLRATPSFTS